MTPRAAPPAPAKFAAAGSCGCPAGVESPGADGAASTSRSCACCLPALTSPDETLAALRTAVAAQTDPVVTLTQLLRLCRDEHPLLWERVGDRALLSRIHTQLAPVRAALPPPGTARSLEPTGRAELVRALQPDADLPVVVLAYHLAQLLDAHYGHAFVDFFRRHSPYQPGVGDPVPLDSPDLPALTDLPATSPPWRLANRLDQTRRIRLAGEWAVAYRVVFDYSLYDELAGVVGPDTVIATCHPNRGIDELRLPADLSKRVFPVGPADPQAQAEMLHRLIGQAVAAGASIVVLPELCLDESTALDLRRWVQRPDGPRLLVAGSYHHRQRNVGPAAARRENTALSWIRGSDRPLRQDKHSPAEHPIAEDIQPQGWPQIRIIVAADGWHVAVAVCRDLLNPQAVHALTEAGANLVLVPAMSETLVSFGGPAAHLVGTCQALVAIANNPALWPGPGAADQPRAPARGLFGHPGFGQQIRLVAAPDPTPGVALLTVRTGQVRWLPAEDPTGSVTPIGSNGVRRPAWARRLAAASLAPPSTAAAVMSPRLRAAAVLVVLADATAGPRVLLTRRAADLADYPDQLVFPGGLVDPGDDGAVDTALREAEEEVGLDPACLDVLGVLHPIALVESGHLVTPVLARLVDASPALTVNQAEVTATAMVPLRSLTRAGRRRSERDEAPVPDSGDPSVPDDASSLGAMTAAVVDQLLGILSR